ncbi:MAG: hypothetical protein ABI886_05590 [Betaproteobacteria bacterium]
MSLGGGTFLAGAPSRLLPASIPFRYFGAAVVFHIAAWLALAAGAADAPRFVGGLGWPLAALHLVTLGVLAMTAIGASLQLLPVASRQPVRVVRAAAAIWWLYTPGVAAVAAGMGAAMPRFIGVGAVAVFIALAIYAALLASNLAGARGMPVVIAHGWASLASLVATLATALALAGTYLGVVVIDRGAALALHVAFAAYGFMGLLALGLSYILVPMFALSSAPGTRAGLASLALAVLALLLAGAAAFGLAPVALRVAAVAAGAAAAALHLRLMAVALATGMRRALGLSFVLVRVGWVLLAASLAAALAVALDAPFDGTATLFGVLLVPGWLLTFLLGILQRIVPFLGSLHAGAAGAAVGRKRPPTPSALTAGRPLAIHFGCHVVALALLATAVVADNRWLALAAGTAGAAGAVAFGVFFAVAVRRMGGGARAA